MKTRTGAYHGINKLKRPSREPRRCYLADTKIERKKTPRKYKLKRKNWYK